ncbi:Hypothetical_protein [Hexamita inflata]|uniref:Hypothetical_protein n=1 Tax=Hexamita inflata TaxID=28002 RepID=A0AA86QTA2_9EUKA|nr:Hypothetical protein HINF_LOCUS53269 [Hexamita inflata]
MLHINGNGLQLPMLDTSSKNLLNIDSSQQKTKLQLETGLITQLWSSSTSLANDEVIVFSSYDDLSRDSHHAVEVSYNGERSQCNLVFVVGFFPCSQLKVKE